MENPNSLQEAEIALVRAILTDPSGDRVRKCIGWGKAGTLRDRKLTSLLCALETEVQGGNSIESSLLPLLATTSGIPLAEIVALQEACTVIDELSFASNRTLLHEAFLRRKREAVAAAAPDTKDPEQIEKLARVLDGIARAARGGEAMSGDRFANLRFDPNRKVTKPAPALKINDTVVCTFGNLALITAKQKHGKTAASGATLGAIMKPLGKEGGDTFGISADNSGGLGVLHLDTEQSLFDHHNVVATAMVRAGVETPPPWFYSYGLLGVSIADCWAHLEERLFTIREKHGGVYAVLLDGIGDLVIDVNDAKECVPLVLRLQALAVRYNCAIICVLHLNPSPNGQATKSRGHLGSTLERKAEVDLRIVKDTDEISTIFTACSRREPIPEASGPQFKWSPEQGMHVSTKTKRATKAQQVEIKYQIAAEAVFEANLPMTYTDLRNGILRFKGFSPESAERWALIMRKAKIVTKNSDGLYTLTPKEPPDTSVNV